MTRRGADPNRPAPLLPSAHKYPGGSGGQSPPASPPRDRAQPMIALKVALGRITAASFAGSG